MSFSIVDVIDNSKGPVGSKSKWVDNYKEAFLEKIHDSTQMDLVLPDDCLIVAGPPRMTMFASTSFNPIGFVTSFSVQEQRQIQPLKAIGSRRHVFSATNAPVNLTIERMLIDGRNLMRALYQDNDRNNAQATLTQNSKFMEGTDWYVNLEEDIYRIPFGLGICFYTPRKLANKFPSLLNTDSNPAGFDYFEGCVVQSMNMSLQQGGTVIMEQVSILSDRRIPVTSGATAAQKSGTYSSSSAGTLMNYAPQAAQNDFA